MKKILKQILLDFQVNDGILYDTRNADWQSLKELVQEQGLSKNSNYADIKNAVVHIFEEHGSEHVDIQDPENWLDV